MQAYEAPVVRDVWWRFDAYELRDGFIRPAPGARLEQFDPWEPSRETAAGRPTATPHGDLLDLARRFVVTRSTAAREEMVLGWCARWGLLGFALARAVEVRLEPGPLDPSDTIAAAERQDVFSVIAGRWVALDSYSNHPGDLVSSAMWRPRGAALATTPLTAWSAFFDVAPDERCPPPYSPAFWRAYGEPYADWVSALSVFERIAAGLMQAWDARVQLVGSPGDMVDRDLEDLAAPASISIRRRMDGVRESRWRWPALETAIALMIIDDMTGNVGAFCKNEKCGHYLIKRHARQEYCSPTCKNRWCVREYAKKHPRKPAKKGAKRRARGSR